jgi:hypothetical protein
MSYNLLDFFKDTPSWLLSAIGTALLLLMIEVGYFAYALFKYGKDIRKLNEFEAIARFSRTSEAMEAATVAFGKMSDRVNALTAQFNTAQDRIGTLTSKLDAIEKLLDDQRTQVSQVPASLPQNGRSLNDAQDIKNWETIREGWYEVRDAIEAVIEALPPNLRRKYSEAKRYSYAEIIDDLQKDNVLDNKAALAAKNINQVFLQVRPRNAVIDSAKVQNFAEWLPQVRNAIKRFLARQRAKTGEGQIELTGLTKESAAQAGAE